MFLVMGTFSQASANNNGQTVVVVNRLVLWARPSMLSRVVVVLTHGRRFTVTNRSASGRWLYGVTDRDVTGWLPSFGFLQLHPEVRLADLPIRASGLNVPMMPTMRRSY